MDSPPPLHLCLLSVVEGSVIQLYCSVEPDNATVSWTKDSVSVIIDVPHLVYV